MKDDISSILKGWGEPAYRIKQVEDARRTGIRSWEDVTTLPKDLREKLSEVVPLWTVTPDAVAESTDGTLKWRLRTHDGLAIESVLINAPDFEVQLHLFGETPRPRPTSALCAAAAGSR